MCKESDVISFCLLYVLEVVQVARSTLFNANKKMADEEAVLKKKVK